MVGFVENKNEKYAGHHLLVDMYDCSGDMTAEFIIDTLESAAIATGATVLSKNYHLFDNNPYASSGVVILAESHATYHYWDEEKFIAIDIFVCGLCDPHLALPLLKSAFNPKRETITLVKRGIQNLSD